MRHSHVRSLGLRKAFYDLRSVVFLFNYISFDFSKKGCLRRTFLLTFPGGIFSKNKTISIIS